jgi:hypothetical protein
MKRKAALLFTLATLAAIVSAAAFGAAGASASSRIVACEGTRKLVALPPQGGRPRLLLRLERGALLSVGASRNGGRIVFVSRTHEHAGTGEATQIDRVWVMDGDRRPRLVRTFVARGRAREDVPVEAVALSPDGNRVLLTRRGGRVSLMNSDGSDLRQIRVPGYGFGKPLHTNWSGAEFTPDGRHLIDTLYAAVPREERVRGIGIVPLAGGRAHFLRSGLVGTRLGSGTGATVSPDGRFVAFAAAFRAGGGRGDQIILMRRDGSGEHRLAATRRKDWVILNPDFSPNGRALTFLTLHSHAGIRIGIDPSLVETVRRSGTHPRVVLRQRAQTMDSNPLWLP